MMLTNLDREADEFDRIQRIMSNTERVQVLFPPIIVLSFQSFLSIVARRGKRFRT